MPERIGVRRLRSDANVEHLATAIHAVVGIDAMGTEDGAIGWVGRDLRGNESVSRAAVGAAAFGLLAFRLSHGERSLKVRECRRGDRLVWNKGDGIKTRRQERQALMQRRARWGCNRN